jgi:ribosomal-protein-alanine N-acetyltransferase
MKSRLNIRIDGSHIYLRPVVLNDAAVIRKWHNDPEIVRLARVGEKKTTLKQEKADISAARRSRDQAYHIIAISSDNTPIGFLRFNYIDTTSGNTWLRVIIGDKRAWGRGYAGEAMRGYLKWLFNDLHVHRVTLECYSTNLRAIRFYKKLGFKQEGILREAVLINGKYHDIIAFGMLQEDFES